MLRGIGGKGGSEEMSIEYDGQGELDSYYRENFSEEKYQWETLLLRKYNGPYSVLFGAISKDIVLAFNGSATAEIGMFSHDLKMGIIYPSPLKIT